MYYPSGLSCPFIQWILSFSFVFTVVIEYNWSVLNVTVKLRLTNTYLTESCIYLSLIWNKKALRHYFLSSVIYSSVYQNCFFSHPPLCRCCHLGKLNILFLNFWFMYWNVLLLLLFILFISKKFLFLYQIYTIGILFSVFLRPVGQLQDLADTYVWKQISHPTETRYSQMRRGWNNKVALQHLC